MLNEEKEYLERSPWWDWFVARAHGPHAIFWLVTVSFLEPIILPLIPESLMAAMILAGREHWKKYAAITAIASACGGLAGYGIGLFLFREFGHLLLGVYGFHQTFYAVQGMFSHNIFLVMLFITLTPIPDKAYVILAGFFHVPLIPYTLGFFLGRCLRFGVMAYVVYRFGEHILGVVRRYFEWVVLVFLIILFFALLPLLRHALLYYI